MSSFFGLTPADKEAVLLEPGFLLVYYCGLTWTEATRSIPTAYKRWLIERVGRELQKTSDDGATATRGLHGNTPDVRAAQGRQRAQVPAKLRRFT